MTPEQNARLEDIPLGFYPRIKINPAWFDLDPANEHDAAVMADSLRETIHNVQRKFMKLTPIDFLTGYARVRLVMVIAGKEHVITSWKNTALLGGERGSKIGAERWRDAIYDNLHTKQKVFSMYDPKYHRLIAPNRLQSVDRIHIWHGDGTTTTHGLWDGPVQNPLA